MKTNTNVLVPIPIAIRIAFSSKSGSVDACSWRSISKSSLSIIRDPLMIQTGYTINVVKKSVTTMQIQFNHGLVKPDISSSRLIHIPARIVPQKTIEETHQIMVVSAIVCINESRLSRRIWRDCLSISILHFKMIQNNTITSDFCPGFIRLSMHRLNSLIVLPLNVFSDVLICRIHPIYESEGTIWKQHLHQILP